MRHRITLLRMEDAVGRRPVLLPWLQFFEVAIRDAIHVSLLLINYAARATAWLFKEVVVPGAKAAARLSVAMATQVADRVEDRRRRNGGHGGGE